MIFDLSPPKRSREQNKNTNAPSDTNHSCHTRRLAQLEVVLMHRVPTVTFRRLMKQKVGPWMAQCQGLLLRQILQQQSLHCVPPSPRISSGGDCTLNWAWQSDDHSHSHQTGPDLCEDFLRLLQFQTSKKIKWERKSQNKRKNKCNSPLGCK